MDESEEADKSALGLVAGAVDIGLSSIAFPPIASILVSGANTFNSIRDAILVDNLKAFLSGAQKADKKKIEDFLSKLTADRDSFIKKIVSAIDRMNDEKKSKIIGNLFVATVEGKIHVQSFSQLCFVIEKIFVDDLLCLQAYDDNPNHLDKKLRTIDDPIHKTQESEQALLANGLITLKSPPIHTPYLGSNPQYIPNMIGRILLDYGIEDDHI